MNLMLFTMKLENGIHLIFANSFGANPIKLFAAVNYKFSY